MTLMSSSVLTSGRSPLHLTKHPHTLSTPVRKDRIRCGADEVPRFASAASASLSSIDSAPAHPNCQFQLPIDPTSMHTFILTATALLACVYVSAAPAHLEQRAEPEPITETIVQVSYAEWSTFISTNIYTSLPKPGKTDAPTVVTEILTKSTGVNPTATITKTITGNLRDGFKPAM